MDRAPSAGALGPAAQRGKRRSPMDRAPSAGALGPAAQRGTIEAIYYDIGYPERIYLKGEVVNWGRDIPTPESGGLEMGSLARARARVRARAGTRARGSA